jgi:hypothetical protein
MFINLSMSFLSSRFIDLWTDQTALAQAVLVAVSLLAAFLTVVQVWQIPPPSRRLSGDTTPAGENALPPIRPDQSKDFAANLLSNNFSRTVLGGLVGLTAVTFLDSLFTDSYPDGLNAKAYYLVLFVAFFLTLLIASALLRGLEEAIRSRISLPRLYPVREGSLWIYGARRFGSWLASFRSTLLVFIDTAFNVVQGKNQLQTEIFSRHIGDLHEAMAQAADRVCESVHHAVIEALNKKAALPKDLPHDERVRVNVSLVSADSSKLFYIARQRGSMLSTFNRRSVAFVAAYLGEARWCKFGEEWEGVYLQNHDAVLDENQSKSFPWEDGALPLEKYYQFRGEEDYKGFIVLPLPWLRRGAAPGHRIGAIHISFKEAKYLDALWQGLETMEKKGGTLVSCPNYQAWRGLLEPASATKVPGQTGISIDNQELCAVLHQALEVLGDALSHFDDEVFEEYVLPRRSS